MTQLLNYKALRSHIAMNLVHSRERRFVVQGDIESPKGARGE